MQPEAREGGLIYAQTTNMLPAVGSYPALAGRMPSLYPIVLLLVAALAAAAAAAEKAATKRKMTSKKMTQACDMVAFAPPASLLPCLSSPLPASVLPSSFPEPRRALAEEQVEDQDVER